MPPGPRPEGVPWPSCSHSAATTVFSSLAVPSGPTSSCLPLPPRLNTSPETLFLAQVASQRPP